MLASSEQQLGSKIHPLIPFPFTYLLQLTPHFEPVSNNRTISPSPLSQKHWCHLLKPLLCRSPVCTVRLNVSLEATSLNPFSFLLPQFRVGSSWRECSSIFQSDCNFYHFYFCSPMFTTLYEKKKNLLKRDSDRAIFQLTVYPWCSENCNSPTHS